MNTRRWVTATLAVGLSLASATSTAALIDQGAYSTDTATSIDWLKLSAVNGFSYEQVAADALGYIGSGWRFATQAEVTDLFSRYVGEQNGKYSSPISGLASSYYLGAYDLVLKLGMNLAFNDSRATYNIVGQAGGLHQIAVQGFVFSETGTAPYTIAEATAVVEDPGDIYAYLAEDTVPFGRWGVFQDFAPANWRGPFISSFLVRGGAAPEPTTLALLGFGLAALVAARRRSQP